MERTFAIVKPDAVRRGLTGDILKRIEAAGITVAKSPADLGSTMKSVLEGKK